MSSLGTIKSCLNDAREQVKDPLPRLSPRVTQLTSLSARGAETKLTPTPPQMSPKYKLGSLKSPRKSPRKLRDNSDTFLYAEKYVNPVIERLAQQLVLHNPNEQQVQSFIVDAINGKSLSTKYPVSRDLTALKKTVGSDPKNLLPIITRKVLDNLILAIFKTRPTNLKEFISQTVSDRDTVQKWIDFTPQPKPPKKRKKDTPKAAPKEPSKPKPDMAAIKADIIKREQEEMAAAMAETSAEDEAYAEQLLAQIRERAIKAKEKAARDAEEDEDSDTESYTESDDDDEYGDTLYKTTEADPDDESAAAAVNFLDNMYGDLMGLDDA